MGRSIIKLMALCLLLSVANANSSADLINTKVDRTINMGSHLVYVTNTITVENAAKSGAQHSYTFVVEPSQAKHVSIVTAQLTGSRTKSAVELEKRKLNVVELQESAKGRLFKVELKSELAVGKSVSFEVEVVLFDELKPYPTEITQAEKQLVVFNGNHYYYSLYSTKTQKTTVKLSSDKTERYSQLKPVSKSDSSIVYGPYTDIKPFEQNEMRIHYENNSPFLKVNNLVRTIEVSHWGNIAVEETIDLFHYGAQLKGSFSRFEYMRKQGGASSVKSIHSLLPTLAADVYYRDEIGNISTSNLRKPSRSKPSDPLDFELTPRFPLFGGWKTHYTIGYNLPIYQYLFNSASDYLLKMKLIDHIYANQFVETATIKIILPEHSTDLKLIEPYPVKKEANSLHYTYIDTVGRPVIVLHKKNTCENHIMDFQLKYKYQKIMILKKPLILVGVFLTIFTAIILLVRIDFSLSANKPVEHAKKE